MLSSDPPAQLATVSDPSPQGHPGEGDHNRADRDERSWVVHINIRKRGSGLFVSKNAQTDDGCDPRNNLNCSSALCIGRQLSDS